MVCGMLTPRSNNSSESLEIENREYCENPNAPDSGFLQDRNYFGDVILDVLTEFKLPDNITDRNPQEGYDNRILFLPIPRQSNETQVGTKQN